LTFVFQSDNFKVSADGLCKKIDQNRTGWMSTLPNTTTTHVYCACPTTAYSGIFFPHFL